MTDDRLTIADLERALSPAMNRSRIQRYDERPGVQEILGKEKGTYPAWSLPYWRQMAEAANQKTEANGRRLVEPSTAHLFLQGLMSGDRLPTIDVPAETGTALMAPLELAENAITLLERIEAHLTCQPRADRLLKADHACKLLACSESTLRKRVKPVLPGRWRWSDVMRYIEALA